MRRLGSVAVLVVLAACSSGSGESTTTPPTGPSTSTTLSSTTTLSSRDLFDLVSPSLAFVSTDLATGSGVLLEEGLIVTNAHVVWPYETVRVVFPDGTEIPGAPVLGVDTYTDIALIGPVDVDAPALPLAGEAPAAVGDTVYLVGYPGEVEDFPTPAVTRGLVSRLRTWTDASMTFIQTDALISGGQSGGALVSEDGRLLGISGMSFTPDGFALAAEAAGLEPRLAAIRDGTVPARFADVGPRLGPPATDQTVELRLTDNAIAFQFEVPLGTDVEFAATGDEAAEVTVLDGYGYPMFGFDATSGEPLNESSGSTTTDVTGPFFIVAGFVEPGSGALTLTSSVDVQRVTDPDDGREAEPGSSYEGNMDYPGDVDLFRIDLAAGETITVRVDGLIDAELFLDDLGSSRDVLAYDSDSGGGMLGLDPEIVFTADAAGTYYVGVQDYDFFAPGGYVLTVF